MEYKAVNDKQIAEVGYGDGVYGPTTLGIKFKPWKPENPITEYHYGNVSADLHAELLAADDGTGKGIRNFFDANIKAFPNHYPFKRVS
jgi:hypothetical protein